MTPYRASSWVMMSARETTFWSAHCVAPPTSMYSIKTHFSRPCGAKLDEVGQFVVVDTPE